MKRRSFFATLAGLVALPAFVKAKTKPKYPLISNEDFILPYIDLRKDPLLADGTLFVMGGHLIIYSMSGVARHGDTIATNKAGILHVVGREFGWSPVHSSPIKDVECYKYKVITLQNPKTICGHPVIKIDGKYRLYKQSLDAVLVQFKPIMSSFREG